MAQTNNADFYLMALKALKLQGENAPIGSDARLLYQTKANSLRNILKTQFGMTNIDADYGAGVALANTPGGGKIDWNVLGNAADILGTTQAGSTRSAFDRALGEYLTRNLPVWQKQSAAQPTSASSTITSTATPVMGGTSPAAGIVSGGVVPQLASPTSVGTANPLAKTAINTTGRAPGVGTPAQAPVSGMGAVAPTGAGADATITNWKVGDVVPPGYQAAAGGTSIVKQNITGVDVNSVYGQFIQSQYFKNNDFLGWALEQGVNLPFKTDASGKKIFDTSVEGGATQAQLDWYGKNFKIWNDVQTLSTTNLTLADPASIEKNPAFLTQVDVLTASITAQIHQNNAAVDAQVAGLAGKQESEKAGLTFQLNTIKREIATADWRSRQSLAASGMAFTGMLGYLYGQNAASGMNQVASATATTGADLVALGNQMAILTASKLTFANDLDVAKTTQLAALRASFLDPQNKTLQDIYNMATTEITSLTGEAGTAKVTFETGARGEAAAVATAASEDAKWWITMSVNALDKGIVVGKNADGSVSLTQVLSQKDRNDLIAAGWPIDANGNITGGRVPTTDDIAKWMENGIYYDPVKKTLTHMMTPAEAETNRHNLEMEKIGKMNGDTSAAVAAETKRHNGVMEAQGAAGGTGTTNPDGTPVYDQKPDLSIMSNGGADSASVNMANLRLMAGTGAISDTNLADFMGGMDFYYDKASAGWVPAPSTGAPKGTTIYHLPGLMGVDFTEAEKIIHSVSDPVRQASLAIIYGNKDLKDASTSWFDAMQSFINENSTKKLGANGYDFSTNEIAALEKIFISYYGTQPPAQPPPLP
jgi:hypothetical protein